MRWGSNTVCVWPSWLHSFLVCSIWFCRNWHNHYHQRVIVKFSLHSQRYNMVLPAGAWPMYLFFSLKVWFKWLSFMHITLISPVHVLLCCVHMRIACMSSHKLFFEVLVSLRIMGLCLPMYFPCSLPSWHCGWRKAQEVNGWTQLGFSCTAEAL
jgi:hypothetical protein